MAAPDPDRGEPAILHLLLQGSLQVEIAARLGYSKHTVYHASQRLCQRHGVTTTVRLIAAIWAARCAEKDATIAARDARIAELTKTLAVLGRREADRRLAEGGEP